MGKGTIPLRYEVSNLVSKARKLLSDDYPATTQPYMSPAALTAEVFVNTGQHF